MNDALRKKNREDSGADPVADAPFLPPNQRKAKKWYVILAALALLGGAIIGGTVLWQTQANRSPFLKTPLPAKPPTGSAEDTADPSSMRAAPQRSAFPSRAPSTNEPPPKSTDLTVTEPPSQTKALPPPGVSKSVPHQNQPLATEPAAAETPAEQTATKVEIKTNSPALEGSQPSPTSGRPQKDMAFEPGPNSSAGSWQSLPQPVIRSRTDTPPVMTVNPSSSKSSHAADENGTSGHSETDLFYQKALACHRSGRLAQAARFYRNVLSIDADHHQALLNLAAVYIAQGDFNQAHPILKQLEGFDPRPNGVLLNLAITALGNNDAQAALSYLDQAQVTADAPLWQIQFHRALALARLNRFSEALTLYKQVETKRPGDYRIKFNLALTYDALGDYPQALYYYDGVLKADQTSQNERSSIVRRMELLRRYLNTHSSQAKRQSHGKTHR